MAKRCPNFSAAEISVLTDEVESKKDILFSKQNSTVSNALKRDAWKEVALKVNAVNTTGYVGTGEEMKKWICLSSESRKKLGLNRREQRKTGGGCLPSDATLRPIDEKIEGIIGETSISGVEGGIDVLDSSTTTDALLASPSNMTHASIGTKCNYMTFLCTKLFLNTHLLRGISTIILYSKYLNKLINIYIVLHCI